MSAENPAAAETAAQGQPQSVSQSIPSSQSSTSFLIPSLFPRRSINLLIGTPQIGRLRFILPQLESYAAGGPFLDIPPLRDPEQLGMVVCGRSRDSIWHKIHGMDLPTLTSPQIMPIVGWSPQIEQQHEPLREFSLEEPYRQLAELCPAGRQPRLILVEGLQLLQTSGKYNDPQDVAIFTAQLQEFCDRHDCVVLGTVGMAKMKNNDTYTLLPHKIIGSGQWAVGTSCLMGFEKVRGLTCREITMMARDGHFPTLYADFDCQGRLMMVGKPEIPLADNTQTKLDQMLALDTNGEYSYADLVAWGSTLGVSLRTVDRWIRGKVAAGELEKVGSTRNVTYRKPIPN